MALQPKSSSNHCCCGKQKVFTSISVFVYTIVFVILHVNSLSSAPYSIVLSGLSTSTIFFSYFLKSHNFRKKKHLLNIKYVVWFSVQVCLKILILRRIQWDVIIPIHRLSQHIICPIFLADFNGNWIFYQHFRKS